MTHEGNRYAGGFSPSLSTICSPLLFTSLLAAFLFVFLVSVAAEHKPASTTMESQAAATDWKAVEVALGKAGANATG